jgi:hypothetical protein
MLGILRSSDAEAGIPAAACLGTAYGLALNTKLTFCDPPPWTLISWLCVPMVSCSAVIGELLGFSVGHEIEILRRSPP